MRGLRGFVGRIYPYSAEQVRYSISEAIVEYEANGERKAWDKRKVLYVSDTGKPISVVSDRYKVLQPNEFIDAILEVSREIGMARFYRKQDYSRIEATIIPNKIHKIEIDGDEWNVGFRFVNSYDATTSVWTTGILYRVVCENGLLETKDILREKIIHTNRKLVIEFRDAIGEVVEQFEKYTVKRLKKYTEIYVPKSAMKELFTKEEWEIAKNILYSKGFSEATRILYSSNGEISMYDAINIITYITTHIEPKRTRLNPLYMERKQTNMINKLWKILRGEEEVEVYE